jgi:hypothetical protein
VGREGEEQQQDADEDGVTMRNGILIANYATTCMTHGPLRWDGGRYVELKGELARERGARRIQSAWRGFCVRREYREIFRLRRLQAVREVGGRLCFVEDYQGAWSPLAGYLWDDI